MELWLKGLLEIVGKLKFLHNNLQKIKEERIPLLFFLTLSMIVSGIELQYFPSKTQHRCVWFHIRILQFGIQYSFKISVSRHKSVSIRFPVPGPFASLARHNRRGVCRGTRGGLPANRSINQPLASQLRRREHSSASLVRVVAGFLSAGTRGAAMPVVKRSRTRVPK